MEVIAAQMTQILELVEAISTKLNSEENSE